MNQTLLDQLVCYKAKLKDRKSSHEEEVKRNESIVSAGPDYPLG